MLDICSELAQSLTQTAKSTYQACSGYSLTRFESSELKLNSYSNASVFVNAVWWAVSFPFRLKRHCLNAHAECFQMTNRIVCHEREMLLKLNFFQLMERCHSWHSVLISIYRLDAYDLKKRKCTCDKGIKKRLCSSMNSALKGYL